MATSNKIERTPTPAEPPKPAEPPAEPPKPAPAEPNYLAETLAARVRQTLTRAISRDSARAFELSGPNAPSMYVVVSALVTDIATKDWKSMANNIELLVLSLGVTMTPADRDTLLNELSDRFETAVITDPGPKPVVTVQPPK